MGERLQSHPGLSGIARRLRRQQDCVLRIQHGRRGLAADPRCRAPPQNRDSLTGGMPPVAPPPEIDPVNFLPRARYRCSCWEESTTSFSRSRPSQKPLFDLFATPAEQALRDLRKRRARAPSDRIHSRGVRLAGPLPWTCAALDHTERRNQSGRAVRLQCRSSRPESPRAGLPSLNHFDVRPVPRCSA